MFLKLFSPTAAPTNEPARITTTCPTGSDSSNPLFSWFCWPARGVVLRRDSLLCIASLLLAFPFIYIYIVFKVICKYSLEIGRVSHGAALSCGHGSVATPAPTDRLLPGVLVSFLLRPPGQTCLPSCQSLLSWHVGRVCGKHSCETPPDEFSEPILMRNMLDEWG